MFKFWHWKWPVQETSTVPIVSAHFRSLFRLPVFSFTKDWVAIWGHNCGRVWDFNSGTTAVHVIKTSFARPRHENNNRLCETKQSEYFHTEFDRSRYRYVQRAINILNLLSCSLAVLDPTVGHTIDVLYPFISVLRHSDWRFHGESSPRLDVVHPGCAWSPSPACTWHCS